MRAGRQVIIRGGVVAFTIVELLAVMVVIVLLVSLSVSFNSNSMASQALVSDAEKLTLQLSLGQQIAISENRPVEVRFFHYVSDNRPGNTPRFFAYQLWRIQNDGTDAEPVDGPMGLNDGIVISENMEFSSLVALPRKSGFLNESKQAEYVAFQYLPSGETNLPAKSESNGNHWFVTFLFDRDEESGVMPTNFATVQIDPFTGSTRILRL